VSKDTTIILAAYHEMTAAEADWDALEAVAKEGLYVADAALVTKDVEGNPQILERQSHHGWGKGAIAGAVVGVLFPPALIGSAIVGGVAGAGVARLNRSLGRDKVKDLGEVLDVGEIALVAVVDTASLESFTKSLVKAAVVRTAATGLPEEELRQALAA
jgi:uncharacterized membrane protein